MNARKKAYDKGFAAEKLAALYLRAFGYKILHMRYKSPVGEVDIIACQGRVLVAVEVKARDEESAALYAVIPRNQKRVEAAIGHFLSLNPQYADYDIRFDVIALRPPFFIRHLDNAWRPAA